MSMTLAEFSEAYTKLLVAAWSDERFAARLKDAPREVANEVGLDIPAHVAVTVVPVREELTRDGVVRELADYHDLFEAGIESGAVRIVLSQPPIVDLQDLNDEDLATVAGGGFQPCWACCTCTCA